MKKRVEKIAKEEIENKKSGQKNPTQVANSDINFDL